MPFGSLWLAVLVSTIAVFIVSSVMHAVLTYHRHDFAKLPDEGAAADLVDRQGVAPGQYMVPHATPEACRSPDFKARWAKGPNFLMVVAPRGVPSMGKALLLWTANVFVVSFATAYVARHALSYGAAKVEIARIAGTVAILAYTMATPTESIWKWRPWRATGIAVFDGVVYGLVTAACFALLWPSAP